MKAYSEDLRERVVKACDEGTQSRQEIAERFSVCTRWIRKPYGGGHRSAVDSHALQRLREELDKDPDATLEELCERCKVLCSV